MQWLWAGVDLDLLGLADLRNCRLSKLMTAPVRNLKLTKVANFFISAIFIPLAPIHYVGGGLVLQVLQHISKQSLFGHDQHELSSSLWEIVGLLFLTVTIACSGCALK